MADFSHYSKPWLPGLISYAESGARLTDQNLLDVVKLMHLPDLSPPDRAALLEELDVTRPRKRGHPTGGVAARKRVAAAIALIPELDPTPELRRQLLERLNSGKRFTETARALAFHRQHKPLRSHMLHRCVYKLVCAALVDPESTENAILPLELLPNELEGSLRDRALVITQRILRERLKEKPPSLGRLRNTMAPGYRWPQRDRP